VLTAHFSTCIDQYKGGLGILVKTRFLKQFPQTDLLSCWQITVVGRMGRLTLHGPCGAWHIVAVYLGPNNKEARAEEVKKLRQFIDTKAYTISVGDFNFVERDVDRVLHYPQG